MANKLTSRIFVDKLTSVIFVYTILIMKTRQEQSKYAVPMSKLSKLQRDK